MPLLITATQAKNQFSDIVNRVMYQGEEFLVQKQGKPAILITKPPKVIRAKTHKKFTMNDFLLKLPTYGFTGPKNLSKNLDTYAWD